MKANIISPKSNSLRAFVSTLRRAFIGKDNRKTVFLEPQPNEERTISPWIEGWNAYVNIN